MGSLLARLQSPGPLWARGASFAFAEQPERSSWWISYAGSAAIVAAITAVGFKIEHALAPTNIAMVYLLAVVVCALRWGRWPAVLSAALSAVAFRLFFIHPNAGLELTVLPGDIWYAITFLTLLLVGLLISTLAGEARKQARQAERRGAHALAMYSFSQTLISAADLEQIVRSLTERLTATFRRPVLVALGGGALELKSAGFPDDETEQAAAACVWRTSRRSGRHTDTYPSARGHYLPLQTARGVEGVVGLLAADGQAWLNREQDQLLEGTVNQAALAIERALLEEQAQQAQLLQERDRMERALLNSVSHNLRTPLASISGTLSSLVDDGAVLDEATRLLLLENALEQSVRLNRLVTNLLDGSRLEGGALRLRIEPSDVRDVVNAALSQLGKTLSGHPVLVNVPPEMPPAPMDFTLISQVLVNIVENAARYSDAGRRIEIGAERIDGRLRVRVADEGDGIAECDLERIFERFRQIRSAGRAPGAGLGLYIARGFVEAHGGRIWAARRAAGGSEISFEIPVERDRGTHAPLTDS